MADKKRGVAETVRAAVEPVAEEHGLVLWDVLFVKEGPSWFLRLIIDKPGGVFLDDCETLSRAVDPIIDELDPTDLEYFLEVSSPGLGRALRTDSHLAAYRDMPIVCRLYSPHDGSRELRGLLGAFDSETVTLTVDGQSLSLPRQNIASMKADDDDF